MDQRELKLQIDALQKALQTKEPASNIVAILEKLKKEVEPTEELLRVCSSYHVASTDQNKQVVNLDAHELTIGYYSQPELVEPLPTKKQTRMHLLQSLRRR